jgi:hypothetical protein
MITQVSPHKGNGRPGTSRHALQLQLKDRDLWDATLEQDGLVCLEEDIEKTGNTEQELKRERL